jgi:hypothetical protein
VSSVLDGMMDVTVIQRLPLLRNCLKVLIAGSKIASLCSGLRQKRSQGRMKFDFYDRRDDFKYRTPIRVSGPSRSNVRGAACASVKDLKLLRVGWVFQPLSELNVVVGHPTIKPYCTAVQPQGSLPWLFTMISIQSRKSGCFCPPESLRHEVESCRRRIEKASDFSTKG